jgi:hypothetical protein
MNIIDRNGVVELLCDRCRVSVKSDPNAVVGLQGPDIRVYHAGTCTDESFQYLVNSADRQLSLAAFMVELSAAAGL